MNSWNSGDLLKSKESGQYVTFIAFSQKNEGCFIGTDTDGITYTDWLIHKFEKVEVPNEKN